MLNLSIAKKSIHESLASICLAAVGTVVFVTLFIWAMLEMGIEIMEFVSQISFVRKILEVSLGIDVTGNLSINVLIAVCFTHAVVLTLAWTVIVATATRITAGELERGTADFLLSLPVRRSTVYC